MSSPLAVCRTLHWVLKIGNLRKAVDFYTYVFGMKVLRHEEFESGCDAQCNGDFDRPWSKTMIGYGDERSHFALELTYNYGIRGYRRGNDLKYISLFTTYDTLQRAEDMGFEPEARDDFGFTFEIKGPDDVIYKCILRDALPLEPFDCIALNVKNVAKSYEFWCDKLSMNAKAYHKNEYLIAQYGEGVALEFHELQKEEQVDFGAAAGRIAFGLSGDRGVYTLNDMMKEYDAERIAVPPVTLSTDGKADVDVIILNDDGFESCFVGQKEFDQLCEYKAGDDYIDWEKRASMNADKDKGLYIIHPTK